MTIEEIKHDFKDKVCDKISIINEGKNRYRIFTPFKFEDGDHLAIVLKHKGDNWAL